MRRTILALHCALLIVAMVSRLPDAFVHDDVYITFRYAQHVADGHGLVFSPGEHHLGTTAPLYAMVLGVAHAASGVSIPHLAAAIHIAALLAILIALRTLARKFGDLAVPWAGLGTWPIVWSATTREAAGMETLLFAGMSLSVFALAVARRPGAAGVLAAAACLVRPDAAAVVALTSVWLLCQERGAVLRFVLGLVLALSPWLVGATLFYGSPLPATVAAKAAQGRSDLWPSFASVLLTNLAATGGPWLAAVLAATAVWLGGVPAALVAGWTAVHTGTYVFAGAPYYPWYLLPWIVQASALAALAAGGIATRVATRLARPFPSLARPSIHEALVVLVAIGGLAYTLATREPKPFVPGAMHPTKHRYWSIAEWLHDATPPDAALATTEVGILGYRSHRPIVDLLGLVTPGLAELVPSRQHVAAALARHQPEWVLVHRPPWPGLEQGLPALLAGTHVLFKTVADCELWFRWNPTPAALAEAALGGLPSGGRCAFEWLPTTVDFGLVAAEFARQRPDVELVRDRFADCAHWLRVLPTGRLMVVPARDRIALRHGPAELASWPTSGGGIEAGPEGCSWSDPVLAFTSPPLALPGPITAMRVEMTLPAASEGVRASAWFTWRSSADPEHGPATVVEVELPRHAGRHEIVLRFPERSLTAHDVLHDVVLVPTLARGRSTLHAVSWCRD